VADTKVVVLSGGIGSGKSTVARMFERLGARVIDADAIVHELQSPGSELLAEIVRAFGPGVLDAAGALDRAALAALVFRDAQARERLNHLVHPRVGAEMARRLERARTQGAPLVLLDIPLFFEGRRQGSRGASALPFHTSVLVWVPRETQIQRTVARDGCPRDEAERRLAAQLPLDEKRALADFVVDNSGSLADTERQVREVYARLTGAPPAAAP
jgi:dephospho-CoA kinase